MTFVGWIQTFKEFRTNSPSVLRLNPKVIEKDARANYYSFTFLDSLDHTVVMKEEIWGFCVKGVVFVNAKILVKKNPVKSNCIFVPIDMIGRYCFLSEIPGTNISVEKIQKKFGFTGPIPLNHLAGVFPNFKQFVININNGSVFLLDKDVLKEIYQSDVELYSSVDSKLFKKESAYFSLIAKFNQRNQSQIKSLE